MAMQWVIIVEITGEPARAIGPFRSEERADALVEKISALLQEQDPTGGGVGWIAHKELCWQSTSWRDAVPHLEMIDGEAWVMP